MAVDFYRLTRIDFGLSENALWDACIAQWLIVSSESFTIGPGLQQNENFKDVKFSKHIKKLIYSERSKVTIRL